MTALYQPALLEVLDVPNASDGNDAVRKGDAGNVAATD